jgi:hypothetical protein
LDASAQQYTTTWQKMQTARFTLRKSRIDHIPRAAPTPRSAATRPFFLSSDEKWADKPKFTPHDLFTKLSRCAIRIVNKVVGICTESRFLGASRVRFADGAASDSVNKPVHKLTLLGANFLIGFNQFIERAEMD